MNNRMPAMDPATMNEAQRAAAAALVAGPRKGVFGPFVPLLRSPALLERMQRVGEYLRFDTAVPQRLNEWAILVTARFWTNQFEWAVHHPLAIKAGVASSSLDALARRERPAAMAADEAIVLDFVNELLQRHQVSDARYAAALELLGEQGVVDLLGTVGYFSALDLLMNALHTPAPSTDVPPLAS
jgi:4-carboxymuconolactone decarboxylase